MLKRLQFVRRVVVDLPREVRLAYCLMRDPRVPVSTKLLFAGALALIATPVVDIPVAIPLVGEIDAIALTIGALRLFIAACPNYIVREQRQLILEQRSRFDEDVRNGERVALLLFNRLRHADPVEVDGAAQAYRPSEPVPEKSA